MNFLIAPRRAGKSVRAITLASEIGGRIIVPNRAMMQNVVDLAKKHNLHAKLAYQPESFLDVTDRGRMYSDEEPYVIDDVDTLLQSLFPGHNVVLVTGTGVVEK